MTEPEKEYLTVTEFAKLAGVSRQAVQQRMETSLAEFVIIYIPVDYRVATGTFQEYKVVYGNHTLNLWPRTAYRQWQFVAQTVVYIHLIAAKVGSNAPHTPQRFKLFGKPPNGQHLFHRPARG